MMIRSIAFLLLVFCSHSILGQSQNVGIGTTSPDPTAALEVSSTDQGILVPRMTTNQRTAITNPANSLLVYDTDTRTFWYYDVIVWKEISRTETCFNVLNHGAIDDQITDNNAIINNCILALNAANTVNGVNLGWEMCIPKNVKFDFDLLTNLPDDYIINDHSTFDWQRPTPANGDYSTYWTAQIKKIIHTDNPGMKNANEWILMADYHPALTIDNFYSGAGNEDYQASVWFASSGDRKWKVGMGSLDRPDFLIVGRTPAPANDLTARMHILDDFGNYGFNTRGVQGIDYSFADTDDGSNPLNFKFTGGSNSPTNFLFHHNNDASVSTSRMSFYESGKISLLQGGNYGTTFGENQTIYGNRKEVRAVSGSIAVNKWDTNGIITNEGAMGFTQLFLPQTAIRGVHTRVVVIENHAIVITPSLGDQLRGYPIGTSIQSNQPGASIELYSVVPGIWEINVLNGTWN